MSRILRTSILMLAICLVAPDLARAGDPGDAGVLSMRLGVGGRSGAMGESGVALARDATAMYWNPANMAYAAGTQISLQHMEYFSLFRQESLAVSHQTDYGTVGLLFTGFYSDELDRTSLEPTGVVQGSFRPYDVVAGLGYAIGFSEFSLGVTGKVVYERIDAYSGAVGAFDFGITHQARIPGLFMAAAIQNVGQPMKLNEEEFDLPLTARVGMAYRPLFEDYPVFERFVGTAELVLPNDGNGRLHAGLEARLHETFTLRAGHRFRYDVWGATFGAGFERGPVHVDYAFMVNDEDFDSTHRFSLRLAYMP